MPDTLRRLAGPMLLPGTTAAQAAVLYTVPANTTAVLRYWRLMNTTATAATATLSIGADAAATRLVLVTVQANAMVDWVGVIPLVAGETIQGWSATNLVINAILSGVETT